MPIRKIFTVHDVVADTFLQPFFARTTGEAVRQFSDACADVQHDFSKHSDDFVLYEIGTYEDSTAVLVPIDRVRLGNATDFKKSS